MSTNGPFSIHRSKLLHEENQKRNRFSTSLIRDFPPIPQKNIPNLAEFGLNADRKPQPFPAFGSQINRCHMPLLRLTWVERARAARMATARIDLIIVVLQFSVYGRQSLGGSGQPVKGSKRTTTIFLSVFVPSSTYFSHHHHLGYESKKNHHSSTDARTSASHPSQKNNIRDDQKHGGPD